MGPRAGLDTEAVGKILCLCRDRTPVVQSAIGPEKICRDTAISSRPSVKVPNAPAETLWSICGILNELGNLKHWNESAQILFSTLEIPNT